MLQFPSDIEDKILKYMRAPGRIPYPDICAEACGVPREHLRSWLKRGREGDRRYEGFAREVSKIVAAYVETLIREIQDENTSASLRAAKLFLLQRLEQETFDPPKARPKEAPKAPEPESPPVDLQTAVDLLAQPARH